RAGWAHGIHHPPPCGSVDGDARAALRHRKSSGRGGRHRRCEVGRERGGGRLYAALQLAGTARHRRRGLPKSRLRPDQEFRTHRHGHLRAANAGRSSVGSGGLASRARAYAKRNPEKITFGSSGYGTQRNMLGEMLKRTADINIIHVPYRGAGQSVTDLLAGQVQMIFETTAILLPHVQGGRLRALAVATEARSPLLPGVPTTAESGDPKPVPSFWCGLLAPAGTPSPIVAKLNAAINDILKSNEAQAGFARLGAEAKIGSPHDFAAFIAAEAPRWTAIANETGIKVD